MEEIKPEKPKGIISKLKDAAEDKEHQIEILGTFVRLGVVVWSGFIITMNYVDIPMVKKSGNSDITFVASVFTVTDTALPWSLETTTRAAGLVEQWDTTRNYNLGH